MYEYIISNYMWVRLCGCVCAGVGVGVCGCGWVWVRVGVYESVSLPGCGFVGVWVGLCVYYNSELYDGHIPLDSRLIILMYFVQDLLV